MNWHNQWHSAADFLAMGGYGFFVWGSFIACALLMSLEPLLIRTRWQSARRVIALEQLAQRAQLAHSLEHNRVPSATSPRQDTPAS
jgi:heme exporter protein D